MNTRRSTFNRIICGFLAALVMLLPIVALMPARVLAAGETWKWKDNQVVTVSGGDIKNSELRVNSQWQETVLWGMVTYQNKCVMNFQLKTSEDGTYGIVYATGVTEASDVNVAETPSCTAVDPDGNERFPGVLQQYQNKVVTLGDRPVDADETENQKTVTVTVNSPNPASDSPGSVTITMKDDKGKNVEPPNEVPQQTPSWEGEGVPEGQRAVEYVATYKLEPGNYEVCETGIHNSCQTFTKEKFKTRAITFGESFVDRDIAVAIEINYFEPVNSRRILGPADVTLEKADGSGSTKTIKTDSFARVPTDEQADSDAYGEMSTTLRGTFKNIAPGQYKICVPIINECQTVTKKEGDSLAVVFKTRKAEQLTQGYSKDPDDGCPAIVKGWSMSKVFCPLVTASDKAVQGIEEYFVKRIVLNTEDIFGTSSEDGVSQSENAKAYYAAWNSFRIIAIAIIIIAGTLMVFSEALGMQFMDAYTIRKVLPRLLIAVIIISISWWVLQYVVQLFNNITVWTAGAINYPFQSIPDRNASAWTAAAQAGATTGLLAVLGPLVVISYAGTVFLAMLIATFVLIVREILILLAVIMAPLFIVMLAVPNLEKMWVFWRNGLIGLLIMGPIFIAVAESGYVFAKLVGQKDPTGVFVAVSIIAPLLAIPYLFLKIGGGVGALLGFVDDKRKGGFDRLKNYRTSELQSRKERAKRGELYQGAVSRRLGMGGVSRRMNAITMAASSGGFKRGIPITRRGRLQAQAAAMQRDIILSAQHAKSDEAQAGQFNDLMLQMQTYSSEEEALQHAVADFGIYQRNANGEIVRNADGEAVADMDAVRTGIAAAKANGGFGRARQTYAAVQLANTGTGYANMEQVAQTMARVSHGNEQTVDSLAFQINKATKGAKRFDLTPGSGGLGRLALAELHAAQGTGTAPTDQDYHQASLTALRGVDMMSLSRNEVQGVQNFSQTIRTEMEQAQVQYDAAVRNGSTSEIQEAENRLSEIVALARNVEDSGLYAPARNIAAYNEAVAEPDRIAGSPLSNIRERTEQRLRDIPAERPETRIVPEVDPVTGETILRQQVVSVPNPAATPPRNNQPARDIYNALRHQSRYDQTDNVSTTPPGGPGGPGVPPGPGTP